MFYCVFCEISKSNFSSRKTFLLENSLVAASASFKMLWLGPYTAWKLPKYGVISGPYFPVLGLNTEIYGVNFIPNRGKYGPEITPYLDTFHAVILFWWCGTNSINNKKKINIFKVGKCQKKKDLKSWNIMMHIIVIIIYF